MFLLSTFLLRPQVQTLRSNKNWSLTNLGGPSDLGEINQAQKCALWPKNYLAVYIGIMIFIVLWDFLEQEHELLRERGWVNKSGLPFSPHSSLQPTRWLSRNRCWSSEPKHFLQHLFFIKVTIPLSNLQPPTSAPQSKHSSLSAALETHSRQAKPYSLLLTGKSSAGNALPQKPSVPKPSHSLWLHAGLSSSRQPPLAMHTKCPQEHLCMSLLHIPPCAITIDLGLWVPQHTPGRVPCLGKTCHCCLFQTSYTGQA